MSLAPPNENKGRAVLRALVESSASLLPVAGALARLYQTTHPSQFAHDVERWQGDITATVNDLAERLVALEAQYAPQMALSELALEVACWLVGDEARPAHWPVDLAAIIEGLPRRPANLIAEAAHELADAELVTITPGGDFVRASWMLIWLFQPLANGVSPVRDAADLGRQALTQDRLNAQEVHEATGWPVQRVNAAFELVASFAPPGHVSRPAHPVFTAYGIYIDAGTRRRVRTFIGAQADATTASPMRSRPRHT